VEQEHQGGDRDSGHDEIQARMSIERRVRRLHVLFHGGKL
jgi:hypothetical protein